MATPTNSEAFTHLREHLLKYELNLPDELLRQRADWVRSQLAAYGVAAEFLQSDVHVPPRVRYVGIDWADMMETDMTDILKALKRAGGKVTPRWHGNGFIQLALGMNTRLHIWPSEQRTTPHNAMVHDHTYDMQSKVLYGGLWNVVYRLNEDGGHTHDAYAVSADRKLTAVPVNAGNLQEVTRYRLQTGDAYELGALQLHKAVPTVPPVEKGDLLFGDPRKQKRVLAVTIMTRSPKLKSEQPTVICPAGEEPFDAHGHDPWALRCETMWEYIAMAMNLPGVAQAVTDAMAAELGSPVE